MSTARPRIARPRRRRRARAPARPRPAAVRRARAPRPRPPRPAAPAPARLRRGCLRPRTTVAPWSPTTATSGPPSGGPRAISPATTRRTCGPTTARAAEAATRARPHRAPLEAAPARPRRGCPRLRTTAARWSPTTVTSGPRSGGLRAISRATTRRTSGPTTEPVELASQQKAGPPLAQLRGGPAAREGQPTEQAVPLRVNAVGAAALPVWFAWKPKLVLPPAGMVAL